MAYTVTNQKPAVLDPIHIPSIQGDFDPLPALKKALVEPLFTPVAQHPVSIRDSSGTDVTDDELMQRLLSAVTAPQSAPRINDELKDLYQQTLVTFDKKNHLLIDEIFLVQSATRAKLPAPSPTVLYSAASDVIPSAKALLSGQRLAEEEFFSSLGYLYHPDTLGVWFQTAAAFDDFIAWTNVELQTLTPVLPADVQKLVHQFASLTLDGLTESLILRKDDTDGNHEYSFPRLLMSLLMTYQHQQQKQLTAGTITARVTGLLPFTASELFQPKTVVLVNVEAHARASAAAINKEWSIINQGLTAPVRVIPNGQIAKLTAVPRAAQRAAAAAAVAGAAQQARKVRSASVVFRKAPPSKVSTVRDLHRVVRRMTRVNHSMNPLKTAKASFSKASRRHPDDPNKPGISMSTQYMRDIHVFLDCSGSISEQNYREGVMTLIQIAKKLNVNLYFTSFSDVISQPVLLKTQNKSVAAIWREFRKIPKVDGGTEFSLVWDYINERPHRGERLNLMLTDFEWTPLARRQHHPKNLYYAPVSGMDWDALVGAAQEFTAAMRHIDPLIHHKLIGMVK